MSSLHTNTNGSILPEYSVIPFIDTKHGPGYHARIRAVNL